MVTNITAQENTTHRVNGNRRLQLNGNQTVSFSIDGVEQVSYTVPENKMFEGVIALQGEETTQ